MPYKILVVDDDPDIRQVTQQRLVRQGYEVSLAADAEDGLLRVKEDNPDVILLDLMLPGMNGFDALKEIRSNFKDKWRPVIIISSDVELDSLKECYSLEADHYLTKPCTMEEVLRGIETVISLIPLHKKVG